jgi:hypothetical protein
MVGPGPNMNTIPGTPRFCVSVEAGAACGTIYITFCRVTIKLGLSKYRDLICLKRNQSFPTNSEVSLE